MIVIEEDKDIRKGIFILQQADSISGAIKELKLNLSTYDCEIISIAKTPIVEVLDKEEVAQ